MATRDAINEEVERLRKVVQRDELNFVEHVLGIAGERVPKNKASGQEITSIRVERSIQDMNGLTVDGFWEVTGDPNHGGLPRGYDLDLFTGIMAVWSRGDAAAAAHFRRLALQAPAAHRPGAADPLVPASPRRARPPLWRVDQRLRHDL